MDSRKLGIIIVILSIVTFVVFLQIRFKLQEAINEQINLSITETGECVHEGVSGQCPFEKRANLALPTFLGIFFIIVIFLAGFYLIFKKDKKNKEDEQKIKDEKKQEKFNIILSALNEDEQKIMKAVKEQDGISQSTLRIRTDMSKTKLSLVLKELEKKNLVKKVVKGKTNQIFLKRAL